MAGNWFEAGPISIPATTDMAFGVTVTNVGFSSPTVSTSRAYDITDSDNVTAVTGTVLSGSASISTSTWTTPIILPAAADKSYRIETDISDSGNTITLVLFVNVPY